MNLHVFILIQDVPVWPRDALLLTTHGLSIKIKDKLVESFQVKTIIHYNLSYFILWNCVSIDNFYVYVGI